MQKYDFQHRHKQFSVILTDSGTLQLYLDNCLRKERPPGADEPQYVWTNVELDWEEHHYIEARYWAGERRLQVTINRKPVFDSVLSP